MLSKNMSLVLGLRRIRLPVIQEEEGSIASDGKSQLPVFGLNEETESKKTHKMTTTNKNKQLKKENARKQGKASPLKLPPLSDANYSRNSGPKQSLPNTSKNFGKNLIKRKATNESKNSANIKENHSPVLKSVHKSGGKFENGRSLRPMEPLASKTSTRGLRAKSRERSYGSSFQKTSLPDKTKKSSKLIKKKNQNGSTKEIIKNKTAVSKTDKESESYEIPKNQENVEDFFSELQVCRQPPSQSFFGRNQTFLTDCMKAVTRNDLMSNACELCEEAFKTVEELLTHKKKHEKEKEVCLLCDKIFLNSKDFINHLLTHDGIDRFSCETCGKYFLSGKKYRGHCKEFHLLYAGNRAMQEISSRTVEDSAKNLPPTYESKQSEKH